MIIISCNNDNNLRIYDVIELCVFIIQFIRIVFTFYRIQILRRTLTQKKKKKIEQSIFIKTELLVYIYFRG